MKLTNKELYKIKDITFRHDLHYNLWDWLAKHPDENKRKYFHEYPKQQSLAGYSRCFACAYADDVSDILNFHGENCELCPFNIDNHDDCLNGLYESYVSANSNTRRTEYAKKIRDLPLNPMFNFKDVRIM